MGILVLGTVALDSIETPFGKVKEILGGSAVHFASAAAFFTPVALAAVVGEDFPNHLLTFLKERGVDLKGVKSCRGRTFRWEGRYGYDLNTRETLKTELGVIEEYSPDFSPASGGSGYLFLGNIHPRIQLKALQSVGDQKKVALDTMNLWIKTTRGELEEAVSRAELLIINEEEARQFSGESSLVKAARLLHALGPRVVVIKRGEYGALLFYEGEIFSSPGLPLEEVKDPTGAGDSFAGGMIGYLDRTGRFDFETLKKGVIVGSAMASFNVEDFGCRRLEKVTQEEIRGRVEQFVRLADFGRIAL